MARLKLAANPAYAHFHCPGCDSPHTVKVAGPHAWTWNGDPDRPTLKPSVLSNGNGGNPARPRCHSFVTDGQIKFLADCSHSMAGQTVDLPEVEDQPWA